MDTFANLLPGAGAIAIVSLFMWALAAIAGYIWSPYYDWGLEAFGPGLADPSYRIYVHMDPGDRRSRAIFCIVQSLYLGPGAGFFVVGVLMNTWGLGIILFMAITLLIVIILLVFRNLLLKKLVGSGIIAVARAYY